MEKRRSPAWNSVSGCRSPSPSAIRPNSARPPVATTTPVALPPCTTVPISAQEVSSASAAPAATGSGALSAGADSPVRTLSSQANAVHASRRRSAGTTCPSVRRTTSPGTSSVTSTSVAAPSRTTTAVCRTRECRACAAFSARYSLTKPSATLSTRIPAMMTAPVRSPKKYETPAVTASRISRALRSCRPRTARTRTWCVRTAFGPTAVSRSAASPLSPPDRPSGLLASAASTAFASSAAASPTRSSATRVVTDSRSIRPPREGPPHGRGSSRDGGDGRRPSAAAAAPPRGPRDRAPGR